MGTYQVIARNYSEASENKIHDDDVARRYGFRGALVPGVEVYGYLTHPLVERLGESWLAQAPRVPRQVLCHLQRLIECVVETYPAYGAEYRDRASYPSAQPFSPGPPSRFDEGPSEGHNRGEQVDQQC
jgi:hypothetical protein